MTQEEPQSLEPSIDPLVHVEVQDELVTFYLSQARAAGFVYALVVKQLIDRIYRDHDYIKRREIEGKPLAYADMLRADMQAMSWLLVASKQYLPESIKKHPIPPQPPRPRRTKKQQKQALEERQAKRRSRDIRYQQEGNT